MSETLLRVVLDTNILIKAFCPQYLSLDCWALISCFYGNVNLGIAVDYDGEIVKEYRQNLHDNEIYQKWYVAIGNQISYCDGKLEHSLKTTLVKNGFHEPTDHVFVAVALHADKQIITEDSDYGKGKEEKANTPEKQQILSYLTEQLRLHVMDSREGLAYIRQHNAQ